MHRLCFSPLLLLGLLAAPASADLLSGRVVDVNGIGVPGVDIDAKNLGSGGDPTLFNDGTDANGFFNVTIPAGIYRITFNPPPPPASTHLVTEIEPVTVLGVTNMGTVVLDPGVSVSGRLLNPAGFPVAGVNLDVIDSGGDNINLIGDTTSAFGEYAIAVPTGPIELRFDATPVLGQTLASQSLNLSLAVNTSLADLTLPAGFALSGSARLANGVGVTGVDVDVHDSATGQKLYTPGDNTGAGGLFSVVVPAGTWDVSVCPQLSTRLVANGVENVPVSASTSVGNLVLQNGVLLFGNVKTFAGVNHPSADVDVLLTATGQSVFLCSDNANGAGNYTVVVPPGVLDVIFSPAGSSMPLGRDVHVGVVVAADTSLNGVLPSCPFGTNYGAGLAGTGGIVPHLTTVGGAPHGGNPGWAYSLQDGVGGGVAVLLVAPAPLSLPLFGGTLLVDITRASLFLELLGGAPGSPGAGSALFAPPIPLASLAGTTLFAQFGVRDFAAPQAVSLSEGYQVTICP